MEIGNKVLVLNNPTNDESFREEFSGLVGIVKSFYGPEARGMIEVEFESGEVEAFWDMELDVILS